MRLDFELNEADSTAFQDAVGEDEKRMYCVPFDIEGDRFVKGFVVVTTKKMYKILDGKVLETFNLNGAEAFTIDVFYGNCAFYGRFDGNIRLVCRFLSTRNLKRYSILRKAIELYLETGDSTPIVDDTRERYCPKCGRPYLRQLNICTHCVDKKEVYSKMFAMTKGTRLMMMFPLLVSGFGLIFRFVVPYIESLAINKYIQPENGQVPKELTGFFLIMLAVISIDLVQRIINIASSRMSVLSHVKLAATIRNIFFEKVQSLSVSSLQKHSTGDLMGRMMNDVSEMQSFVIDVIPQIFTQFFSFIIAFAILMFMNWKMALLIFVPLPFSVFLLKSFWKSFDKRNFQRRKRQRVSDIVLHDIFYGIRVVKAFGTENLEIERFEKANEDYINKLRDNEIYDVTFSPIVYFVTGLGNYFVMLFGYLLLYDKAMDLGTLYQILSYAGIVFGPIVYMTDVPKRFSNFMTATTKIFEILEEPVAEESTDIIIGKNIEGNIEYRDVTFGYQSYNPILKNISLSIKKGEFIGIVGLSGSGKSTLINLLMRLYEPDKGGIYFDGINGRDINRNTLCSQMGVVLQETFLFSGSIRDNISYSMPHATEEQIIAAAKMAHAHDFIMKLPYGYETIIGERGHSLSGGERQRIAIARAIIHNPKILILDEATAALDTETEKLIQDALNKASAGRTTIAIAHRLSTLRNADRLIVLDNGRLSEFGTHTELLANKGIYYKLVMAQRKMASELVETLE